MDEWVKEKNMKMNKKRKLKSIEKKIKKVVASLERLSIVIVFTIVFGIVIILFSKPESREDVNNILVGIGTGIVTSALVSLFIDMINKRVEKRKQDHYKMMLLNPLYKSIRVLYIYLVTNLNEYLIIVEGKGYILLPQENTDELSEELQNLKNKVLEDQSDELKKQLEKMIDVPIVYYRELVSQYRGLALDNMLFENLITEPEYEKLKHFHIIDECSECLQKLRDNNLTEQEHYELKLQLFHGALLEINRILKLFPFIASKIKYENEWLKNNFDDLYFREVIENSDEYIEQMLEKAEAEAEYYAQHPELLDQEIEESEDDRIRRKINEAIWANDAETIKCYFPKINKENKQIQSELTWCIAKRVMKDKELRKLYYEKYGVKYKVRKEKKAK